MSNEEREELDISASFVVEAGVSSEILTSAVEELAGEGFSKKLLRANDEGEWFQIGNGTQYATKQCIVLGDDDLIRDGKIYKKVTVKFKPGSNSGMEFTIGYGNFAGSVLKDIREFRDKLKQKISSEKKAKKK